MSHPDDTVQFKARYKLVCRHCEKDDCTTINFEDACCWSEVTNDPASVSFGCTRCGPVADLVVQL